MKKKKRIIDKLSNEYAPYCFVIPAVIYMLLFSVIPLLFSFGISFTNYNLYYAVESTKFVGIKNYIKMLTDRAFLDAAGWTFLFTAAAVTLDVVLGMFLAKIVTQPALERRFNALKTILILPMMIAPTVIATIWGLMFAPNYGVINSILNLLGHESINWTTTEVPAKFAIIFIEMWGSIPFCFLIFIGALKTVPSDLYEAASIDGASSITTFFKITLPQIQNFVAMVVTIRTMDALRAFDVIYTLTSGGPGKATETIGTTVYKTAFKYSKVGLGSAGAFIFLIIIAIVSFTLVRVLERREDEE